MFHLLILLMIIILLPRALAVVYVNLDEYGVFILKAFGVLILLFVLVFVYEEAIDKPNGVLKFATAQRSRIIFERYQPEIEANRNR